VFTDCLAAQQCCQYQGAPTGAPPSQCVATASACPAPPANYITIDWECDVNSNCTAKKCCMFGKDGGTTSVVTDNNCSTGELLRALNVGGTKCETACAAGEVQLCENDSDCLAPQKCTAFPTNAKQLGVCK
jgi:hypothetical protein